MGYMQGNWVVRQRDLGANAVGSAALAATAIGRGILAGSYGAGAGTSHAFGGLIVGSINAWNSAFSVEAVAMMSMFYGSDGLATAGYKIVPLGVVVQAPGSVAHAVFPTGSIEGSIVVFVPMALTIAAGATQSTYTVSYARGASISAKFVYMGFIVSSP